LPSNLKIISGGQTGVDRAAFDAALEYGLPISGFVPQGRWAEDGRVPSKYKGLTESDSADPAVRTRLNVENSDATVILSHGKLRGGSLITWKAARNARKPCLHIDLARNSDYGAVERILLWVRNGDFDELNVAGPRASKDNAIYADARAILARVFAELTLLQ
jgi:predicted Rossmann fold nucleotide-binding protein DprA/Smf involved in DNA uptake